MHEGEVVIQKYKATKREHAQNRMHERTEGDKTASKKGRCRMKIVGIEVLRKISGSKPNFPSSLKPSKVKKIKLVYYI
jgi:hypothetical protein